MPALALAACHGRRRLSDVVVAVLIFAMIRFFNHCICLLGYLFVYLYFIVFLFASQTVND